MRGSPRMASPLRLTGTVLQKEIVRLANAKGFLVAHFQSVKTDQRGWVTPVGAQGKGFPDLCLVRDRIVFIEVKGDGDRLRPDQVKWLDALAAAGVEAHVIRPKEWRDGTVDRILT